MTGSRKFERLEHLGSALSIGGISIDPSQRRCVVFTKRVRLMPGEFNLLEILMRKAGRVLTRAYLLSSVWGMSPIAGTGAPLSRACGRIRPGQGTHVEAVQQGGLLGENPQQIAIDRESHRTRAGTQPGSQIQH